MNLAVRVEQFDPLCVVFRDIKKNILMNGNFTKMIYAHPYFTMNAIYLTVYIDVQSIEVVSSKLFVFYNCNFLNEIKNIEQQILEIYQQMFRCHYKKLVFKLETQMKKQCMCIPIHNGESLDCSYRVSNWRDWKEGMKKIIIKFIGVWESDTEIGMTYHFVY